MAKPDASPCVRCSTVVPQRAGRGRPRRYCDTCRKVVDSELRRHNRPPVALLLLACGTCAEPFECHQPKTQCPPCARRARQRHRRTDRQRAAHFGAPYEPISRLRVYERDGWVCGICRDAIDPALTWPDPGCASLDHVVALANGGAHLYSNVQAAHWICNSTKGARQ